MQTTLAGQMTEGQSCAYIELEDNGFRFLRVEGNVICMDRNGSIGRWCIRPSSVGITARLYPNGLIEGYTKVEDFLAQFSNP